MTDFSIRCWGFNFILSLTWPALVEAFTPTGAFCWYAAWNLFGWVYAYFFLPETVSPRLTSCKELTLTRLQKNLTLEELDTVFNVGNRQISKYYAQKLPWCVILGFMRWLREADRSSQVHEQTHLAS